MHVTAPSFLARAPFFWMYLCVCLSREERCMYSTEVRVNNRLPVTRYIPQSQKRPREGEFTDMSNIPRFHP